MKSFEGYLKQTAGDTYLLLAGGGIKPLSDFFDTTTSDGRYVRKTGDIMTGGLAINPSTITDANPALAIGYTSTASDPSASPQVNIGYIKFGNTKYNCHLGLAPTDRTQFGKIGYFYHITTNCEFDWVTEGWTKLMALECSTGDLWLKRNISAVGGTFSGTIYGNSGNGLILLSLNSGGGWTEGVRIYPAPNGYSLVSCQSTDSRLVLSMVMNVNNGARYIDNYINGTGYVIHFPSKSGTFAVTSDLPTKLSQLTNDSGYLTSSGTVLWCTKGISSRLIFQCACYATSSYTAYKLTTNWHKSWNIMPCISIRGYNYGSGQNIDTDIVMYHYADSVYSASYINRGSCNIRVFHQFENNVSVFYIDPGMYFGMFNVFMYGGMGTDSIASGWTMEPVGAMAGSELSHNHIANGISTNMACYAGSWNSSSDINKKFNVKSISNILPLYEFNWKDTGKKSYGVIAQYLEKQGHSEFVTDSEFGKTVNYSEVLTYFLAKLSNIVEENNININNRINMLEKRIHNLETPPLLIIKRRKEVYYEAA